MGRFLCWLSGKHHLEVQYMELPFIWADASIAVGRRCPRCGRWERKR